MNWFTEFYTLCCLSIAYHEILFAINLFITQAYKSDLKNNAINHHKKDKQSGLVIRTPDQKLRIFVSSTLKELAEERNAARKSIEKLYEMFKEIY